MASEEEGVCDNMKIVCSIGTADVTEHPEYPGADILELRLDLMPGVKKETLSEFVMNAALPVILTLRSSSEFGCFSGTPDEWFRVVEDHLTLSHYVDIERKYRQFADRIRDTGKTVIASYHTACMPTDQELSRIERGLREFGDIPKIVVAPKSHDDVLRLLSFVSHAKKPVIMSITGEAFRFARALFPLFGSEMVFCYSCTRTSPGQYSLKEMADLRILLIEDYS